MARRTWVSSLLVVDLFLAVCLTGVHLAGGTVACPTHGIINCQAVLTGTGSVLAGIPLPLWGAAWAALGGVMVWQSYPVARRWWTAWRFAAGAGLVWAWAHEVADHHLCLWCSGLQITILATALLSVPWAGIRQTIRERLPQLWQHRRYAALTGLLASTAFVANQWHLGTDRWGWAVGIAAIWGFAIAWLMALWLMQRPARRRGPTTVTSLSSIPLSIGTGVLATACAGGVCSVGVGVGGATLMAMGLSGLLSTATMAWMPLLLQGLSALAGILGAWQWTLSATRKREGRTGVGGGGGE